ncbi:MAG: hypothetical protein F6K19_14635 [Cyanothece sp. SIO1E1]|nr:hypothetical protein [Cyanothece sp. SIO1E1]
MKEYVELRVADTSELNRINSLIGKQIHFSDTKKMKYGWYGRVEQWIDENILLLRTQLYYDGIKQSQLGPGLQLELYEDYKLSNRIGPASVRSRRYEPATKDSWKSEGELSKENSTLVPIEMEFSDEEKSLLELGMTPLQMEDKWFCYAEENCLSYYRSWTGLPWFRIQLSSIAEGRWRVDEALVKADWDLNSEQKKNALVAQIESHLRWIKRIIKD